MTVVETLFFLAQGGRAPGYGRAWAFDRVPGLLAGGRRRRAGEW